MNTTSSITHPIEIVCPNCKAAAGAKCTVPYQGGVGMHFVERFCPEREDKAKA